MENAQAIQQRGRTALARRFLAASGGNIALMAAAAFPLLAVLAFGSVELAAVYSDKAALQDVADAAALMGAREMSLAYAPGVEQRAEGFALAQLGTRTSGAEVAAKATIQGGSITVDLTSHRAGFFANLFPPGGFLTRASATAAASQSQPLCVTTLNDKSIGNFADFTVTGSSSLRSMACAVHSNSTMEASNASSIAAAAARAVGAATGSITPTPQSGAPAVQDPLGGRDFPTATCPYDPHPGMPVITADTTLAPGLHCQGLTVGNGVNIQLAPGVHYFPNGNFYVKTGATLSGRDVVLVFGPSAHFSFQSSAVVDLVGRQSGPFAGMVMVASRDNKSDFEVASANLKRLEGVVYLPAARLVVYGDSQVGGESNWTVSVTDRLLVYYGAKLVINSNYAASPVPVPGELGVAKSPQLIR